MCFTIAHVNASSVRNKAPQVQLELGTQQGLIFVPSWKFQLKPDEEESYSITTIHTSRLQHHLLSLIQWKNWWWVGSSPQEPHKTSKALYSTNPGNHGMWSLSDKMWIGNGVTLHNILYPKH